MATKGMAHSLLSMMFISCLLQGLSVGTPIRQQTYVVLLKEPGFRAASRKHSIRITPSTRASFHVDAVRKHRTILQSVSAKTPVQDFTELANGFSATLSAAEVSALKDDSRVLFVAEEKVAKLYTSRSHEFVGADSSPYGIWKKTVGADTIVAVIDTGIWPESASFSDIGFGSPPSKFKGSCMNGSDTNFKCNNKLIGAKFFGNSFASSRGRSLADAVASCGDYHSPRDIDGHGTHVASTAAGTVVTQSTYLDFNMAPPRGAAYGARLIAYKVFWCGGGAYDGDIIGAMDAAVKDGADVISLSLGGGPDLAGADSGNMAYFAYMATLQGVSVVFAAGNDGNQGSRWFSVDNASPWVLTVAASTIDRSWSAQVALGNGVRYGAATYINNGGTPGNPQKTLLPLIDAANAAKSGVSSSAAELCEASSLNPAQVSGKVVLCACGGSSTSSDKAVNVAAAGGAGAIVYNTASVSCFSPNTWAPGILLSNGPGLTIKNYISSTTNATAYFSIFPTYGSLEAPTLSTFSSMGPNGGSFNVIKPDIAAPGSYIFAADTGHRGRIPWTFLSGTSMATPHVSGYVALIRNLYPTWLPSMIFSAIMTTAQVLNNKNSLIKAATGAVAVPFNYGAGQINPNRAADPGLVYPIYNADYQTFFCSSDSGRRLSLCSPLRTTRAVDLNLPSISFYSSKALSKRSTVRTLLNVGPGATYFPTVVSPPGSVLRVTPSKLSFSRNQTLSYNIDIVPMAASSTVTGAVLTQSNPSDTLYTVQASLYWTFGSITWSNNKGHTVRINVALNAVP